MIGGGDCTILPFHPTCRFHLCPSRNRLSSADGAQAWLLLGTELAALCHALFIRLRSAELSCSFSHCCLRTVSHFGLLFYICTHLRLLTCKTSLPSQMFQAVVFYLFVFLGREIQDVFFAMQQSVSYLFN